MNYTTILHPVRQMFGITCNDYCVADMIFHLSANPEAPITGWCNMSRQKMADKIGLSRRSTIDIINKLEEKGLVERQQVTDFLRTTAKWYKAVTGCKEELSGVKNPHCEESSLPVRKPHTRCEESSQGGVQNPHTIIIDNNNINNKQRRKSEKSSSPSGEEVKSSSTTLEAEKEQVTPTPSSAAPLPDETPDWVKRQKQEQRETMKPGGIKTWEEVTQEIKKAKDLDMIVSRTLSNNNAKGWTVDLVIAKFIEQKAFVSPTPTWSSPGDLRKNFLAWLPKHFEIPANQKPAGYANTTRPYASGPGHFDNLR